jgi:hypothetical protein
VATNAKREQVAAAIASGSSMRQAAAASGVTVRSIYNWLREPAFVARVEELRSSIVETAMGRMISNLTRAASELRRLLRDEDARVRLGAAKTVLEGAVRLREYAALEARMRALEEAARPGKGEV